MRSGTTLITGATRGIGRAIVDRLLANGESVVGIARNADASFPAPLIVADLSDPEQTQRALEETAQRFAIHRLVNNAGFNRAQPLGEISMAAFDEIVELNVRATVLCTHKRCCPPCARHASSRRQPSVAS